MVLTVVLLVLVLGLVGFFSEDGFALEAVDLEAVDLRLASFDALLSSVAASEDTGYAQCILSVCVAPITMELKETPPSARTVLLEKRAR